MLDNKKNGKLNYTAPILLLLVNFIFGCSNAFNNGFESKIVKHAPQRNIDTGWVVKVEDAENLKELVNTVPEAKLRVLYKPQNVFEVFGLTKAELSENLKTEFIIKNTVFKTKPQKSEINVSQLIKSQANKAQNSVDLSSKIQCTSSVNLPTAEITVFGMKSSLDGKTIQLGTTVSVSSALSEANPLTTSSLFNAWYLDVPDGSKAQVLEPTNLNFKFTPDSVGAYTLYLVVQDDYNACDVKTMSFVVTTNAPFKMASGWSITDYNLKLSDFTQLADVSAPQAWNYATGKGQMVAVIDTGINYNHFELQSQLFVNAEEIPNNGIDDDKNGLVDDYLGYDFSNSDAYPFDDDGHGSHVAGLTAAREFGVAPNAKILPIKALSPMGGDSASVFSAVLYAIDRGAKIINMSLGGYGQAQPLIQLAMKTAHQKGVLVVAASGNGHPQTGLGLDIELYKMYPASFDYDNILSVGASGLNEDLTRYSNYGLQSVDVVAPGGNEKQKLISAYRNTPQGDSFIAYKGTSMATPVVAGIAALLLEANPSLSYKDLKSILMSTGVTRPSLKAKVKSGQIVNAYNAVLKAKSFNQKSLYFNF